MSKQSGLHNLVKAGLWAAHNLEVKPDAEVLFTDRCFAQAMIKLRDEEGAVGQPPTAVYGSEIIRLERTPFKGIKAGYSERCNQLFICLKSNLQRPSAR